VQELAMARMKAAGEARKEKEKGVVAGYAKEKGAQTTPSGMVFIPMKEGTGASPKATDKVKVNYEGKLTSGSVFDSSYKRGQPAEFPLNQVIPCWTEGVQKLKVGGKARLVCPPDIAYGAQGRPPVIPGNATLVFEVELLEIAPPAAPAAK
jgi:FKBP-type peptidyl-prolyl cis-trans isomerase